NAKPGFEVAPTVMAVMNDDLEQALYPVKAMLGFYIGGMGSAKRNFHKELMARMGFPDEAEQIQKLFFEGKRDEAIAVVPDAFADEISLCGPRDRIKEKLKDWEDSPVTTLLISGDINLLRGMAELTL
ncbi:MAG: LLM class flavin-dependent oxidoreductase, partial [Proteobacteria bacterium]|nr:LLM class flavin-dependent oxidoreductase [Pseudomonadota bacterium]